jgi:lipoprotein-anchoring transpeptidase ErfK/SrfK
MTLPRPFRRMARHRLAIAVVVTVLLLASVASIAGAYIYERRSADLILPGVRIGDIEVGDFTRSEAIAAVSTAAGVLLDQTLTIHVDGEVWVKSLSQLGVRARVNRAVDQAFALSGSLSWLSRAYHRLTENPVERAIDLTYRYRRRPVRSLTNEVAAEVTRPARDAAVKLADGEVVFQRARKGQSLDVAAGLDAITTALRSWSQSVTLRLEPVLPEVTEKTLGKTVTIDLSTNTLRLLDGFDVVRKYDVGTAMQGYSTPPGTWEVIGKRENPTWYNPAPDTWGAGMPLVIPGGPSSPLGTRALYLNAPGIRIHGTPDTSSVGFYVSHGCIRMRMWEVERLYPLVPIGTPVLIYGSPPWGIVEDAGTAGT